MTLPARFSLLHSDLNDFLFASVGDQQNGMPLSVISALTRLGVDPWEEAARLAALPKVLAAEALAIVHRSTAAIGQRGYRPATGRASASVRTWGRTGSGVGQCAGQNISSRRDVARLPCPWGGSVLRHVVIRR
jgi:hypothetical protein